MLVHANRCLSLMLMSILAVAKHGEDEGESSVADEPSPTSTTPSVSPTPTPSPSPFQFEQPNNATTCQSTLLNWRSSLPDVTAMTLAVTNERGAQSSFTNASDGSDGATAPLVSQTLTTAVASNASHFNWTSVDIPEGWYIVAAFDTAQTAGISAESPPFFVQTGPDVDCLSTASSISPDNPTSSTASPTPAQSQNADTNPTTNSVGQKGLTPGALAGTIFAVIVGIIMLMLAFTYPRWWRHALVRRSQNRRPGGPYYLF